MIEAGFISGMGAYRIAAKDLCKTYTLGATELSVLQKVCLYVARNEFVTIMGPSGSGKSTLLNILGCLDLPCSGSYLLDDRDVLKASDKETSRIRGNEIGFVFQTFNLIPELSVLENVELPFLYSYSSRQDARSKALRAIEQVGLKDRFRHRPAELSGGEMQRVAIARAIAGNPKLVLADEPTGNLDSRTGAEILHLFQRLHDNGATILMVTHNRDVACFAQRSLIMRDGKLVE